MTNSTLQQLVQEKVKNEQVQQKPNENSGILFSSHIKIFDPNSNEVLLQKRADD